jgi:hypothetical protein
MEKIKTVCVPVKLRSYFMALAMALLLLLCCGVGPVVSVVSVVSASASYLTFEEAHVPPKAMEFTLKDQHDKARVYRFPQETISAVFFADYTGSGQLEDWIRPLYDRYQKTIGIYGVADLSAVPGFMRSFVPLAFRTQLQYPVMFDWHGTVSKSYQAQSGQANLYIIDTQGRIVLHLVGTVSPERLQRVMTQIDRLLVPSGD